MPNLEVHSASKSDGKEQTGTVEDGSISQSAKSAQSGASKRSKKPGKKGKKKGGKKLKSKKASIAIKDSLDLPKIEDEDKGRP